MKIKINETYYIEFNGDSYNPFKKAITPRKDKKTGKALTHVHCGKYFINLESALKWVVVDSLSSEFDEIGLTEYVKIYSRKMEELTAACQGLK